jgi:hypothetical protein
MILIIRISPWHLGQVRGVFSGSSPGQAPIFWVSRAQLRLGLVFIRSFDLEALDRFSQIGHSFLRKRGLDNVAGHVFHGFLFPEKDSWAAEDVKTRMSGGRLSRISKARRLFCRTADKGMRYPGVEVARFSGVTTSAVCRLANSAEEAK